MKHVKKFNSFFSKNDNFLIAYHVTKKSKIDQIKNHGLIVSSLKGNDMFKGYNNRLFLTFDKESTKDFISSLKQHWENESECSIIEIDWKKYLKDHKNTILFKDKDFEYYEEKTGRFGGFYIKNNIPSKYFLKIKNIKF